MQRSSLHYYLVVLVAEPNRRSSLPGAVHVNISVASSFYSAALRLNILLGYNSPLGAKIVLIK